MDPNLLGENHFLSLPRPDVTVGPPAGAPDTTTLAAHDFDVDTRTGFMPPQQPLLRLPVEWQLWEDALDSATESKLKLGCKSGLTQEEKEMSEHWRGRVRELPILPTTPLKISETLLSRAHLVLAWLMHFYIHTLPPSAPIVIPPPITLPLLQVSRDLQLPPVITYSDDVLYNWRFTNGQATDEFGNEILPASSNISARTLFTTTSDEAEFYLTSARVELKGVDALELMRSMMDEMFVGDDIATRRITEYLFDLAGVIQELGEVLTSVKEVCKPEVFYHEIRPWFRGEDSSGDGGKKWVFEGIEQDETLCPPAELSGPSAAQSSLIHALDVFLGVDHGKQPFLERMQSYMPRHHCAFLKHLRNAPRPLREFVLAKSRDHQGGGDDGGIAKIQEAYNAAVQALKSFRDKHMIVVALYIIGPARRTEAGSRRVDASVLPAMSTPTPSSSTLNKATENKERRPSRKRELLKGTGGTNLVVLLKSLRDQTKDALLS